MFEQKQISSYWQFQPSKSKAGLIFSLLILIITVGYFGLFFSLKLNRGNLIDSYFRDLLIQSRFLRTIFSLRDLGDYRYQILKSDLIEITILSDDQKLLSTDEELKNLIEQNFPNKSVLINRLHFLGLNQALENGYKNNQAPILANHAKIIIFVIDKLKQDKTEMGLTFNDQGIILFQERINELSEFKDQAKVFEQATILHELGHLLGLEHLEEENCVMNSIVEVMISRRSFNYIPTKFCSKESELIKW